jgi:hypothetical protein
VERTNTRRESIRGGFMAKVSGASKPKPKVQKSQSQNKSANKANNTQNKQTQTSKTNHLDKTNQSNKPQETSKTQDIKQTDKAQQDDRSLTDRQRGIRDEMNSNKKPDGTSEISAQQGDKFGDVVQAGLDKDGDGKLNDKEIGNKEQFVKDLLSSNPALAKQAAEELGLDVNSLMNELSPENLQKLMDMGLKPGEKVKIPGETAEAQKPEEAGKAGGAEEGKSPEEAGGGSPAGGGEKPQEGQQCGGGSGGGSPSDGGESGGGSPSGAEKAGGPQAAQGPQDKQQSAEDLIAQAASLIKQAESGGGQTQQSQSSQPLSNGSKGASGNTGGPAQASSGTPTGGGAQGGSPTELATQAKQLLQQAKGMIDQQGGQAGGAQPQNNGSAQAMATSNPMQAQGNTQNAAMPGKTGQMDLSQITKENLQKMPAPQKLQVIKVLELKADNIIKGGSNPAQAQKAPEQNQNNLAKQIAGQNPFNAANNFAAQNLMKPQIPMFAAA